jgi:REP element-mobilizing transposase RayT
LSLWQRGYYDRIIRNERELSAIRKYIAGNPISWELDRDNPARPSTEDR